MDNEKDENLRVPSWELKVPAEMALNETVCDEEWPLEYYAVADEYFRRQMLTNDDMAMDIDEREKIYQGLNSMMRVLLEVDSDGNPRWDRKKLRYAREINLIKMLCRLIDGENVVPEARDFYKFYMDPYMQQQMEFKMGIGTFFERREPILKFISDEYVKKPFNWNAVETNTEVITKTDSGCGYGLGYYKGYNPHYGKVNLSDKPSGGKVDSYNQFGCYPRGSKEFYKLMNKYARKSDDDNLKFDELVINDE